jgi:hypothetical protein
MASEDILPTYEEVMKTYQTPAHVLRFEARTITYAEESSVSKIKSFLARPDHSHTDDVQVKKTRKSKVAEVLVKVLTGMFRRHTIAIVSMTDLFESSNPEALLDCLEYFEESGSGKTVTLPRSSTPTRTHATDRTASHGVLIYPRHRWLECQVPYAK